MSVEESGRYLLRKAAGSYFIIDTLQDGFPYRAPLVVNEGGAYIWEKRAEGMSEAEIAAKMSVDYEISEEDAYSDVRLFLRQLEEKGIET